MPIAGDQPIINNILIIVDYIDFSVPRERFSYNICNMFKKTCFNDKRDLDHFTHFLICLISNLNYLCSSDRR